MYELVCTLSGLPIRPGDDVMVFLLGDRGFRNQNIPGWEMISLPFNAKYIGYGQFETQEPVLTKSILDFLGFNMSWEDFQKGMREGGLSATAPDPNPQPVAVVAAIPAVWDAMVSQFNHLGKVKKEATILKNWWTKPHPLEVWMNVKACWVPQNSTVYEYMAHTRNPDMTKRALEVRDVHFGMHALKRSFLVWDVGLGEAYSDLSEQIKWLEACLEHARKIEADS